MNKLLHDALKKELKTFENLTKADQLKTIRTLSRVLTHLIATLSTELSENESEANRRKRQREMNAGNPKGPLRPITIAEPYKPKPPKYKGL